MRNIGSNHPAIQTLRTMLDILDGERRLDDVVASAPRAAAPTFTDAERAWFRRPLAG